MMKKTIKPNLLPPLALICGGVGLALHKLLLVAGMDERHLLVPGHPLEIALWVLTAAFLVFAGFAVRTLGGKGDYAANFPQSTAVMGWNVFFAAGILWTVSQTPAMEGALGQIWRVLGVLAALGLAWAGYSRRLGKVPCFAAHMVLCAFLTIHLVTHYRTWSGDPQLQNYVFTLLGSVALVFFTYYHTAFDVGFCKRRLLMTAGLAAMYLCTVGMLDTPYTLLYVGAIPWVWSNFCIWQLGEEGVAE